MSLTPRRVLQVIVPPGAHPGSVLTVSDPTSGSQLQVRVPSGVAPGMRFNVALGSQQPRMLDQQRRDSTDVPIGFQKVKVAVPPAAVPGGKLR